MRGGGGVGVLMLSHQHFLQPCETAAGIVGVSRLHDASPSEKPHQKDIRQCILCTACMHGHLRLRKPLLPTQPHSPSTNARQSEDTNELQVTWRAERSFRAHIQTPSLLAGCGCS